MKLKITNVDIEITDYETGLGAILAGLLKATVLKAAKPPVVVDEPPVVVDEPVDEDDFPAFDTNGNARFIRRGNHFFPNPDYVWP